MAIRIWPGDAHRLGATWDGEGVNFALFSQTATQVELCLFDGAASPGETRVPIRECTNGIWHAYLPDVRPGQLYGYRVGGLHAPDQGQRFNPHKLLIDPYARAISGSVPASEPIFGYRLGDPAGEASFSEIDSAEVMPKCVVVDPAFTWGDDRTPQVPWSRTVIYECHVKGMTARHPQVPERLRGTFLGLVSDPILDHLVDLGVTAVELLPIQLVEPSMRDRVLNR